MQKIKQKEKTFGPGPPAQTVQVHQGQYKTNTRKEKDYFLEKICMKNNQL